jgi:carbon storage regulator
MLGRQHERDSAGRRASNGKYAKLPVHCTKESTMLVLSRKKNESIVINDDITIVVVEIRGDKVRLGVEAPKEVPVHRNEVYEAIRRNQQNGSGPTREPDASAAE